MKICFISPAGINSSKDCRRAWYESALDSTRNLDYAIGLSLLILASLTPDDIEVSLIDENVDKIDFNQQYDLVAITGMTQQAARAYEISAKFREQGVITVMGGIHATVLPEEAGKYVDYVITGEGETVWNEFLNDFRNNKAKKIYHGGILEDINESPIPRYNLIDVKKDETVYMQTTRGCPHDCDFCVASKFFGRKYRAKTVDRVIEEVALVKQVWRNPFIIFADDNMFCNKKRSRQLVERLVDMKIRYFAQTDISIGEDIEFLNLIKKSGCEFLLIGFESLNPVELKKIDSAGWKHRQYLKYEEYIKKIQSTGIGIYGAFIIGLDSDTDDTISNLIDFINKNHLHTAQITILTPFPGSRTREHFEKQGRLLDIGWENYTMTETAYVPKNFTPQELKMEHKRVIREIYSKEHYAANAKYFKDIYLKLRQDR